MQLVDREVIDNADRIERDDVEEGESYIFEWSPYDWAVEKQGLVRRVRVTVTDTSDFAGDIKMRAEDGTSLTDLGESRPYVMGPADNIDSTPDYTDVGRGGRYYKESTSSRTQAEDRDLGLLPGGLADRLTN